MLTLLFIGAIANYFPYANAVPLQQKLEKQWALYDQAQAALISQARKTELPAKERALSRSTWEKMLTLKNEWALGPNDIFELKNSQQQRIQIAYEKAKKESLIDLNLIRANRRTPEFCADLPKGGMLHVHDSGTLDRRTIDQLVTSQNPDLKIQDLLKRFNDSSSGVLLYPNEKTWLQSRVSIPKYLDLNSNDQIDFQEFFFLPAGKHPFPRFESVFSFIGLIAKTYSVYEKILWDFAERAAREKVIYVELRESIDPQFARIFKKIEDELGLTIRVTRAYFRTQSLEMLDQKSKELLSTPQSPWVVGIDLLANEDGNPALEKAQLLYANVLEANVSGRSKLHRTMHSGEIGDIRNPRDAIIMGAERLGHGVNLAKDPVTLEWAASLKIPIEINLSSNLRLTDIKSIETHPFLNYLRLGLPVSLSTDDEGIFDTDINLECEIAIKYSDITYAELKQMSINSIETSFASDADKKILRAKLDQSFVQFENKWK